VTGLIYHFGGEFGATSPLSEMKPTSTERDAMSDNDPEQTRRPAFTLPNEPSEVGLAWRDDARRPGGFDE